MNLAIKQQEISDITHQFHRRERSTEDRLLAATDTAAGQWNTEMDVPCPPVWRGQIQQGHRETRHEASLCHW